MTREELILKISALGLPEDTYSLDGIQNSDCTCIVQENDKWKVYYVERDRPRETGVFNSAEEAYDFIYTSLITGYGLNPR
jgi:hypothetical protein